ncbi:hypothetical protein ElyMa_000091600 [Elysia marginata]|uniref:Uncharacterized protein n=1 Tax=Elysia marginata TaxID=1093978 RepID=A0AAV4EII8_9GAST|nr:hypothetical protein ElyMa_000091600 [Elysia marginata]
MWCVLWTVPCGVFYEACHVVCFMKHAMCCVSPMLLQVAFKGEKGYILFELLDAPSHSSDLVTEHTNQPTLDEALETLKKKSDAGTLMFEVGNKDIFVRGTAKYEKFAFRKPDGPDSGFSGGALTGLCVAMAVLGLAAGGGGGYAFFIRRH